jgi:hypothetical protein
MGWKWRIIIGFWAFWLFAQGYNTYFRIVDGPPECADHNPGCMPEPTPP